MDDVFCKFFLLELFLICLYEYFGDMILLIIVENLLFVDVFFLFYNL